MENNNNKELWINEVLGSTKGMSRPQPGTELYSSVLQKLSDNNDSIRVRIPVRQWVAAAVLLLAVNAASILYYTTRNNKPAESNYSNSIAFEIQTTPTYNY